MCLRKVKEKICFRGNRILLMKVLFKTDYTHWLLQKTAKGVKKSQKKFSRRLISQADERSINK